ncbi:MAG TPA: hypothetical protein VLK25_01370 [Allosphingosinicella sp.]|nr:hypothetical protein [Allosphingosinicella sp.]
MVGTIITRTHPAKVFKTSSIRIGMVHRVVRHVGVEIELVLVADRIDLQKPGLCRGRPSQQRNDTEGEWITGVGNHDFSLPMKVKFNNLRF